MPCAAYTETNICVMKRILIAILALAAMPLAAQEYGQSRTVKIWDNDSAPHSNGITAPEKEQSPMIIGGTSEAVLYIFEADPAVATGQAVVICPGGGYAVVCMGYEGVEAARWLASKGITCGVLKYRMPNGHREVPLEDAVEALRTMRRLAPGMKVDPARVGIMGFSAGGHLAAYASTFADDSDKPAFSVLFYPVITGEAWLCHKGSFDNLLGADASEAERAEYSLETRVTSTTPPAILLLSDDDTVVPPISSTRYYNALKKEGIEASLHIYPSGGHGWGMGEGFRYRDAWRQALLEWLSLR